MTDLHAWLVVFADVLRPLQPLVIVGTLLTVGGTMISVWRTLQRLRRDQQIVRVFVANADTHERKQIADIPFKFASRAEVQGIIANFAGGHRLDFSDLRYYDYTYRKEWIVRLPGSSFDKLVF